MRYPLWFLSSAMAVCAGLSSHAAVSAHSAPQAADERAATSATTRTRSADASTDTAVSQRRSANVQAAPQPTSRPTPRPAPAPTRAPARQPLTSDSRAERPAPPPPTTMTRPATTRPDRSRPVQPVEEAQWMRRVASSYPSRALANEIEGTVGVLLTVTTAGRVGACSVSQSSGAAVLDEAACKAFTRYAVFEPALASDGQPVAGRWRGRVRYRLPSSTAAMTPPPRRRL
ncbi:MAG: energy transducer TonB [Pseudomonadota bacterium]